MNNDKNKQITIFQDSIQRTIIGNKIAETDTSITVENPLVVNVDQQYDPGTGQPTGQMAIQLIPVFFREFMGDKDGKVVFTYAKAQVTTIEVEGGFDFRLYSLYDRISDSPTEPAAANEPAAATSPHPNDVQAQSPADALPIFGK